MKPTNPFSRAFEMLLIGSEALTATRDQDQLLPHTQLILDIIAAHPTAQHQVKNIDVHR